MLGLFSKVFLRLRGWKVVGTVPKEPKYITLIAPHTSNWDFLTILSVVGTHHLQVSFIGKASLFKGVLGWLFYYLGGIPIDRNNPKRGDVVQQIVDVFASRDRLILGITPEGTRSKVDNWKTGFYRMALGAKVPLVLAFIDARAKETGFGPTFMPTGDIEADMAEIQAFYATKLGINPENQ